MNRCRRGLTVVKRAGSRTLSCLLFHVFFCGVPVSRKVWRKVYPEGIEDTEKEEVELDSEDTFEGVQHEEESEDQNNDNIRCRES